MVNGNSSFSNGSSFGDEAEARWLPWVFRHAMPVPVTLVSGL